MHSATYRLPPFADNCFYGSLQLHNQSPAQSYALTIVAHKGHRYWTEKAMVCAVAVLSFT